MLVPDLGIELAGLRIQTRVALESNSPNLGNGEKENDGRMEELEP